MKEKFELLDKVIFHNPYESYLDKITYTIENFIIETYYDEYKKLVVTIPNPKIQSLVVAGEETNLYKEELNISDKEDQLEVYLCEHGIEDNNKYLYLDIYRRGKNNCYEIELKIYFDDIDIKLVDL